MSPSPVGTPSSTARASPSPSATWAASTAPTSTASGSRRPPWPTATRCRSASSAWCSCPVRGPTRADRHTAMTAPGSQPAAARGDAVMSIGEVLDQLRGEFPDITISKLRFLEAEGLVEPQRTAAGYRKYSWPDVTRLRVILAAQRDHYLPLRVIREQLAALDRGEPTAAVVRAVLAAGDGRSDAGRPDEGGRGATVTGLAGRRPTLREVDAATPAGLTLRLSRAELLERSGLSEATLAVLEKQGLVTAHGGG